MRLVGRSFASFADYADPKREVGWGRDYSASRAAICLSCQLDDCIEACGLRLETSSSSPRCALERWWAGRWSDK